MKRNALALWRGRTVPVNTLSTPPSTTSAPALQRRWIPRLGIYDFRNRAYSPNLGRFLQMDPLRFGGGSNFYRFVGNNPVSGTDPFGLDSSDRFLQYTDESGITPLRDRSGNITQIPGKIRRETPTRPGANLIKPLLSEIPAALADRPLTHGAELIAMRV
jgi:RHS repeat-associated protein